MSLIETCINKINSNKQRIKDIKIPKALIEKVNLLDDTEQIHQINKLLAKYYDKHSDVHEYTEMQHRTQLDKLPIITNVDNGVANLSGVHIKFFSINGSYVDMLRFKSEGKKYVTYDTGTKYGNRLVKIVKMTNDALIKNKNIIIDFQWCGGGDINVFLDAFRPVIGTGLMCYYKDENKSMYLYYNGKKFMWTNKEKNISNNYQDNSKNIIIRVSEDTGSSAEYLPMIIKSFNKKCIIEGSKHTAGYLNLTDTLPFRFRKKQYSLGITIAPFIYDRNGKKYNGRLL